MNPLDPLKCDSCITGFSLNYNKTVCLDCKQLGHGCLTCAANLENNTKPETCLTCASGLTLDPNTGKCGLAHCESWAWKTSTSIQCAKCEPGYSLDTDFTCVHCTKPNCAECNAATPGVCSVCGWGSVALSGNCIFEPIDDCYS